VSHPRDRDDVVVRASKALSHILRHRPDQAGVQLDAQGWADINEILAGLRRGRRIETAALPA